MRIEQARVSAAIGGFRAQFLRKYSLRDYHDPNAPAVFFGCYYYNGLDIPAVLKHNSLAVIIWAGSDSIRIVNDAFRAKTFAKLLRKKNTYSVAISKHVSDDLSRAKVPHVYLPVCPTVFKLFRPEPYGDCVYTYSSHLYGWKYGVKHIAKIKERLPDLKFLTGHATAPAHWSLADMPKLYAQCFMGLRIVPHDGLSNTVIELGLMGRRCIWNGWLSNAIPYQKVDDIVRSIIRERKRTRDVKERLQYKVARHVKHDLELPPDWLSTEFYRRLFRRGKVDGCVLR